MQKQRSEYLRLRRKFEPTSVTLVAVAESPPSSGNHFYDPSGKVSEHLFKAPMKELGIQPITKSEGLREFQKRGRVLVDVTYERVNAYDERRSGSVIRRDYPELVSDLKRLLATRWREAPLVLIKANACKLLEPKLKGDGFNVLNKGRRRGFLSDCVQSCPQFRVHRQGVSDETSLRSDFNHIDGEKSEPGRLAD